MKLEDNWPRGFKRSFKGVDGRRMASDRNSSSWAFGSDELKICAFENAKNSVGLLETKSLRSGLSDLDIHAYSKTNLGKNF